MKRKLEKFEFSLNELEPKIQYFIFAYVKLLRKDNDKPFSRRKFLTPDTKSWVDIFNLPSRLMLTKEDKENLWNMHPKEYSTVKIYGKIIHTPRYLQSYGRPYVFSGQKHDAVPIPNIIQKYMDFANSIESYTSRYQKFNMCLVNWYEDGSHYIGYHSDDEKELFIDKDGGSIVFSISFGETRRFLLQSKDNTKDVKEFELKDGSVIVMGGRCQKTHKHSVPKITGKNSNKTGRRINLTFRSFK